MEVEGGKVDDKKMSSRVADGKCGADSTNTQVFGHPRLSLAPKLAEYFLIRRGPITLTKWQDTLLRHEFRMVRDGPPGDLSGHTTYSDS